MVDSLPNQEKWQRERRAFQHLLPELLATHRGKYVLIHEGRVAATGDDELELAITFQRAHGNVPVHVALVTDQPEYLTRIPHYRCYPVREADE